MLPMPSFIRARDPSIMSFNKTGVSQIKKNLNFNADNDSSDSQIAEEDEKYLNVYLRIKGDIRTSKIYKVDEDTLSCRKSVERLQKNYKFTKIFDSEITQTEIFNHVVKSRALSFINGRNFSLLTFGASGSGKTFTIIGTPEEPGLIPRTLDYVFKSIRNIEPESKLKPLPNGDYIVIDSEMNKHLDNEKSYILKATLSKPHIKTYQIIQERLSFEPIAEIDNHSDVTVSLWVSFFEIYNETIYDLLVPPVQKGKSRDKLELGKNKEDNTYIKNLTFINVCDGAEAYQILQYGLENLNYGVTAVNSHSSRSHCIFTVKMLQYSKNNGELSISNFNFCDLAGSERSKKTLNKGERLKESVNINSSLLVLSRCVANIRKQQQVKDNRVIPFRDSKLTQFFQKALMGYEQIQMIVNINSSSSVFEETIHTLNFSAIAKSVIVEEKPIPKIRNVKEEIVSDTQTLLEEKEKIINNLIKENNRKSKIIAETNTQYDNLCHEYNELIDERNEICERYEKLVKEERDRACQLYRELLDKRTKMYNEQIKSLREKYEQKIKIDSEIICISSSEDEDSDDEFNSNAEILNKLQIENSEYKTRCNETQKELEETKIQLEDTKLQLEEMKKQLEEMKRQLDLKIKEIEALQTNQTKEQEGATELSFSHLYEEQCSDIMKNDEEKVESDFKALVDTSESNILHEEEIDECQSDYEAMYKQVKTELLYENREKERYRKSYQDTYRSLLEITEGTSDISFI